MKKLLLLVAMVAVGFTANAQQFGVKAGVNFANVSVEANGTSASPDGATSFYVGALVDFSISEKFHIQPELLYSDEGAKDASLSFISIPVMAKYYVAEGFNLQAGPQLGFVVDTESGDTDGVNTTNFGLGFGAAYEMESGLFFDARYNLGLSDLAKADSYDVSSRTFQLGLGYRF